MSNVACPHYPNPSPNETTTCRGCGQVMGNPTSTAAQSKGLVNGAGQGVTVSQHGANPGATRPKR